MNSRTLWTNGHLCIYFRNPNPREKAGRRDFKLSSFKDERLRPADIAASTGFGSEPVAVAACKTRADFVNVGLM
jgi:hypothetical protein